MLVDTACSCWNCTRCRRKSRRQICPARRQWLTTGPMGFPINISWSYPFSWMPSRKRALERIRDSRRSFRDRSWRRSASTSSPRPAIHSTPGWKANLSRTPAEAYDGTHGFSDQYLVELPVFLDAVKEAGLRADPRFQEKFPRSELATVSINFFTTAGDPFDAGL